VRIKGRELLAAAIEPKVADYRAFSFQGFDVSEISISSHTLMRAHDKRLDHPFVNRRGLQAQRVAGEFAQFAL
jgi:hypothetical protein